MRASWLTANGLVTPLRMLNSRVGPAFRATLARELPRPDMVPRCSDRMLSQPLNGSEYSGGFGVIRKTYDGPAKARGRPPAGLL
jgi:hypothetical protein